MTYLNKKSITSKFLIGVLGLIILTPNTYAFRDIKDNSDIKPAVQYLVDQHYLLDRGFYRPNNPVPAKMFWKIILKDGGFNPKSASFDTPLPPNIQNGSDLAPYLREAIRRGFISSDDKFIAFKSVKRLNAIKYLLKSKGILVKEKASTDFRSRVKKTPKFAAYLPTLEAAYASGIIELKDIQNPDVYSNLTRADFARWVYNWHKNGLLKKSSLEENNATRTKKRTVIDKTNLPYKKRLAKEGFKSGKDKVQRTRVGKRVGKVEVRRITTSKLDKSEKVNMDFRVFQEAYHQLINRYRFPEELTEERKSEMINAGIQAMVKKMGDKYTSYIEPAKVKDFNESLDGKFEGIGAYVEMIDDQFTITSPIVGSPAEKAGIEAGDIVLKVDDEDISELPIREAITKIKGPAGSEVELKILREKETLDITVIRGKITIPSIEVKWKKNIPIVGIHQFSRNTGRKLETLLKTEVLPKNPNGIIFDLRNNPGGYLTAAVDTGEIFLKKGQKIFSVEYNGSSLEYKAKKTGILHDYTGKMVFLQNKGSASASEITTAMIKDYKIGTIMGDKSLGKGTVQEIINFSNEGTLKVTIAKWISPKGHWIHKKGVEADKVVERATKQQRKEKVDPQLEAALAEILYK